MTTATPAKRTVAELLAFPEDGIDRWLLSGILKEKPFLLRTRFHGSVMANFAHLLCDWNYDQPHRGHVLCDAGVILERDPDTVFGIDVVYISPELAANQNDESTLIVGVPPLVVEILSPNDTVEEIHEKTVKYLSVGVPHVWIVDPYDRTVLVHRPNALPELFNVEDELSAEPHLPGFRVKVSHVFE